MCCFFGVPCIAEVCVFFFMLLFLGFPVFEEFVLFSCFAYVGFSVLQEFGFFFMLCFFGVPTI